MRFAAYAGTSTVLAASVIIRAFHERPNFYSAAVYLSQSNACLMILTNLLLLLGFVAFFGLQRLFYGRLRPIEVEQLYERGWFAVTETSLAMTMFRDEIGGWFLVMFVSLLAGKVWNWIGEGRVEFLEQQPPTNPRLFYARLFISLSVSVLYDLMMMNYCLDTVLEEAKPGMMVMFAFEFAVLMINSLSTFLRNVLILNELYVVEQQTKAKLEARRAEIRAAREEAEREAGSEGPSENLLREEDIDESDIDVPGWEEKGRWIFYLDLGTDFFKLVIYIAFFAILTSFHGLPIHIMRDVFLTARSFGKRIYDFLRYRKATHDMNDRYPDATAEELENENTCIICREDMSPWQEPNAQAARPNLASHERMDQRLRAKKLPCGHILHFGCLRSWLERQQVCPTCRRSVLANSGSTGTNNGQPNQQNVPNQVNGLRADNQNANDGNRNWLRNINLGPLRITFGATRVPQQQVLEQLRAGRINLQQPLPHANTNFVNNPAASPGAVGSSLVLQLGLLEIERQILAEMRNLRNTHDQLEVMRRMQGELDRLRNLQSHSSNNHSLLSPQSVPSGINGQLHGPMVTAAPHNPLNTSSPFFPPRAFSIAAEDRAMGPEHPNLPSGMTIPQGWSILPLEPLNRQIAQAANTSETRHDQNVGNPPDPSPIAFPLRNIPKAHTISSSPGMNNPATSTSPSLSSSNNATSSIPSQPSQSSSTGNNTNPFSRQSMYNSFPSHPNVGASRPLASASSTPPIPPIEKDDAGPGWDFSGLSNPASPSDNVKPSTMNMNTSSSSFIAQSIDRNSNALDTIDMATSKEAKGKGKAVEIEDEEME